MAGDLYPLATDVELAKFRDSDPQGRLTVKTEPARRVRPEVYIRGENLPGSTKNLRGGRKKLVGGVQTCRASAKT